MKTVIALIPLTLLILMTAAAQDPPEPAAQLDEHAWLQQLVGEWEFTSETSAAAGDETPPWEGVESARSIGGLWVVVEGSVDDDPQPFRSLMTLGYDPRKQAFVGSWIDSIQTTMWSYVGQLDDAGRVLTLEAEGPSYTDPSETAKYRDQIEMVGPDHKRTSSYMLDEAGDWLLYMTVDARRIG